MVANRMRQRWVAAAMSIAVAGLLLSGCAQSKEETMTPHEARDVLVSTIENSAALLNVTGWNRDHAPEVGNCGATRGTRVSYSYGYGAPQPGPEHDHHMDAKKIADYWTSLGMTVRTVMDPDGDPTVYSTGGPVAGLMFSTSPGNYYINGTSVCVPGNADELRPEQSAG